MGITVADKQALIEKFRESRRLHISTLNEWSIAKEVILKSKRPTRKMMKTFRKAEEIYKEPERKFFKMMAELAKKLGPGVFTAGNFGEVLVVSGNYAWFTYIERVL